MFSKLTVTGLRFPDKVNLERVVLAVEAVLARGVEVELAESVVLAAVVHGSVGADLEDAVQVLQLSSIGVVCGPKDDGGTLNLLGIRLENVDGGLILAEGAGSVVGGEGVPVERTVHGIETVGALGSLEEAGAMMAEGRDGGDERENSGGLHCDENRERS